MSFRKLFHLIRIIAIYNHILSTIVYLDISTTIHLIVIQRRSDKHYNLPQVHTAHSTRHYHGIYIYSNCYTVRASLLQ